MFSWPYHILRVLLKIEAAIIEGALKALFLTEVL